MKFRNKKRGRGFGGALELTVAAFTLLGPSFINAACRSWGLYVAFAAAAGCFAARLLETGRVYVSFNIILGVLLGAYALLAFAWADNYFLHIRYVYIILTATLAMLSAADYYSLEKEKGLGGRLMLMVIFSANLCALWNLVCWAFVNRFALDRPFSAGMGQSDLLGIYMAVGLWCAVKAGADKRLKRGLAAGLSIAPAIVLVMSRSFLTWFFGAAFAAIYIFKKGKKAPAAVFAVLAVVSGALLAVRAAGVGAAFADALVAGLRHPAGLGGGGFFSRQTQLQSAAYAPVTELGAGASLASSLGIVGLLAALLFIGAEVWLTFKYKSWFSAFTTLLGVYAFFAPLGSGLAALILLLCTSVYGEWKHGKTYRVGLGVAPTAAVCCVLAALTLAGGALGVGEAFSAAGRSAVLTDERKAAGRLATASTINPFDGESCYSAANALRYLYEQNGDREDAVNAEYHIKRAIERDEYNALYHSEYARLLADMGSYASAVEEGGMAVELAPLNDGYKADLCENLYRLTQTFERGSVEAQRCYSRILECAEAAADMDKKKIINDWADKAQPYTRIEYFAEGGEEAEEERE